MPYQIAGIDVLCLLKTPFLLPRLMLWPTVDTLSADDVGLTSLLLTLRGYVRSRAPLQLEVLALRHHLQVLERSRRQRLRLTRADRLLWVWVFACDESGRQFFRDSTRSLPMGESQPECSCRPKR
jgi:hypothetical protein